MKKSLRWDLSRRVRPADVVGRLLRQKTCAKGARTGEEGPILELSVTEARMAGGAGMGISRGSVPPTGHSGPGLGVGKARTWAREGTRKKTCGLREARAQWPTLCDAREVEEGLEAGGG